MREGEPKFNFVVPTEQLTQRDLQILELIAGNWSYKEIAQELNLSSKYLKNLVQEIFQKYGVADRKEAKEKYLKLHPRIG